MSSGTALNQCQQAGREGHLAAAMGAFFSWVAGRYEQLRIQLETRSRELRQRYQGAIHARLPGALAELQSGFESGSNLRSKLAQLMLRNGRDWKRRNLEALNALAIRQIPYHQSSDPALRFISCCEPPSPTVEPMWQIVQETRRPRNPGAGDGSKAADDWLAQGARIGWVTGNDLFLDPLVSYRVVQQMAGTERIPLSEQTLRHRLKERGIASERRRRAPNAPGAPNIGKTTPASSAFERESTAVKTDQVSDLSGWEAPRTARVLGLLARRAPTAERVRN